jgi:tetratricopeptide (TPR) repeat protein
MRKQKGLLDNSLVVLTMIGALSISARSQQQPAGQKDSAEQLRRAAATYYESGWAEFGRGNIASTIEKYLESKRLFEEAHAKRDLIYILADLGTLYLYSSEYKTSRLYSEQSLALSDQLKGSTEPGGAWPDEYGIGAALSNLGNVSRHDGEYDKAINYFQESIAAYHVIDNGSSKFRVEILDNLADIGRTFVARGDSLRALNYLNQAMALAKGSDREAAVCNSIGILYTNQRDYAKAVELFQRGLSIAVQGNDPDFDVNEREYKIRLANKLRLARDQIQSNSGDPLQSIRTALRSVDNNIVTWRLQVSLFHWFDVQPEKAISHLAELWKEEISVPIVLPISSDDRLRTIANPNRQRRRLSAKHVTDATLISLP